MKERCDPLAPLLFRVAQHEASAEEALRVAGHVADCTSCRIRLARERHLDALLGREPEELPVDERLVDRVMARLPADPPRQRRRDRRGLKLALWAGSFGLTLAAMAPRMGSAAQPQQGLFDTRMPIDRALPVDGLTQALSATVQVVQGAAGWLTTFGSMPPVVGGALAVIVAATALTLLIGGTAAVGLAGHLAWTQRA